MINFYFDGILLVILFYRTPFCCSFACRSIVFHGVPAFQQKANNEKKINKLNDERENNKKKKLIYGTTTNTFVNLHWP